MRIEISIQHQQLKLYKEQQLLAQYPVNTAKNGAGEQQNSGCTPRGKHIIRAKIGANSPLNTVFVGRRATGEIYNSELEQQFPQRDWVLSRILWLSGTEVGVNRLGQVDTMRRYIYIHGSPNHGVSCQPESHGCVRMTSLDVIALFDLVPIGTSVEIFA